jgi:hypothetical protein
MNKPLGLLLLFSTISLCSCVSLGIFEKEGSIAGTVWEVDNRESIGGHDTVVLGLPEVIRTDYGMAVQFGRDGDGLVVDALPLAGAKKFTLEIIFRPDTDGLREQRFLHLQEDDSESRILIETRLTDDDRWYLDTYIHSDKGSKALFEPEKTHRVGRWYNATLVYDGREMRHYVNGFLESSAELEFGPLGEGKTSIGVRMNRVFWFKGAVRKVRFTERVIDPEAFMLP